MADGNISAAARMLCSDDTPAPIGLNEETLQLLHHKHPAPSSDRPSILRFTSSASFQTTELMIGKMIRSFPMGSADGPDGLRPQRIPELMADPDAGPGLLKTTTAVINLLLAGTCPQ